MTVQRESQGPDDWQDENDPAGGAAEGFAPGMSLGGNISDRNSALEAQLLAAGETGDSRMDTARGDGNTGDADQLTVGSPRRARPQESATQDPPKKQSLLTEDQMRQTRSLFAELDKDKKGILDPNEITALLNTLGHSLSEEELLQAMDDYDVDFENGLNEEDIIKLVEEVEASTASKKRVTEAFALLDADNSGFIDVRVLQALLCGADVGGAGDMPAPLSDAEFTYFIMEARASKDGRLDYRKFINDMLFSRVPVVPVATGKKGGKKGKRKQK